MRMRTASRPAIHLPLRLMTIADTLVEHDWKGMADIGTDHALLSIHVCQRCSERGPFIASDIALGPLTRAKDMVEQLGLGAEIELRLGSGFSAVTRGEVEAVAVCGMGPRTAKAIIDEAFTRDALMMTDLRLVLLQVNGTHWQLRRWLFEMGYDWVGQVIVYDRGKHYIIDAGRFMHQSGCIEMVAEMRDWGLAYDTIFTYGPLLLGNRDLRLCDLLTSDSAKISARIAALQRSRSEMGEAAKRAAVGMALDKAQDEASSVQSALDWLAN